MKLTRVALYFVTKARVYQRLLKMPNAAYPLVTLSSQVWSQSPSVRAVEGSGASSQAL